MPELFSKTKQYHKQRVCSLMVQQAMITIVGMQKHLVADGFPFERGYLVSLVRAIQTERIKRAETWTLNMSIRRITILWKLSHFCEIVTTRMRLVPLMMPGPTDLDRICGYRSFMTAVNHQQMASAN